MSNSQDPIAKIVQFADETKTLPDGSKVIYAENETSIVMYHQIPMQPAITYIYDRKTGDITVNGKLGTNQEKRDMIKLGTYMLSNAEEEDLITLNVHEKEQRS